MRDGSLPEPRRSAGFRRVGAGLSRRTPGRPVQPHRRLRAGGTAARQPGGTPTATIWGPTVTEWQTLAGLGAFGLQYIVLSPDVGVGPGQDRFIGPHPLPPSVVWIAELLMESGIRVAVGHFHKHNPEASAWAIRDLLTAAARYGSELLSDHLFNDMPRTFTHAWRSASEKEKRFRGLQEINIGSWNWRDLDRQLGVVPATLLRAARDSLATLCLNFDGDHVDLAISARIVDLLGADRLIGMTDRVQGAVLGGQKLQSNPNNTLLYQQQGIVAAGSQGIEQQVYNLRVAGVRAEDIWKMFCFVPARVLNLPRHAASTHPSPPVEGSFIIPGAERLAFANATVLPS